jgi:hypothetical protein
MDWFSKAVPTLTAVATCDTEIRRYCRKMARQRMVSADDLNKTLQHQRYVMSSIKTEIISFEKERRKETVEGNLCFDNTY